MFPAAFELKQIIECQDKYPFGTEELYVFFASRKIPY
jgi:hypothetical protein